MQCSGDGRARISRYYPSNTWNVSSWSLNDYEYTYLSTDRTGNLVLWRGDHNEDPLYVGIVDPKNVINWYEEETHKWNTVAKTIWTYTVPANYRLYIGLFHLYGNMDGSFTFYINSIKQGRYRIDPSNQSKSISFDKYPQIVDEGETSSIDIECETQGRTGEFSIQIVGKLVSIT